MDECICCRPVVCYRSTYSSEAVHFSCGVSNDVCCDQKVCAMLLTAGESVIYMCEKCRGVVWDMTNQNFGEGEGNFSTVEGSVGIIMLLRVIYYV